MENDVILPDIAKSLNSISRKSDHIPKAPKIFIGIANMGKLNVGLVSKMFRWAQQRDQISYFHFEVEKRHVDFARNLMVKAFLKTDCSWFAMIDSDVDPNINFLKLIKHDKDIIAANTQAWINNELLPSIWQRANCEQCFCLNKFVKEDKVHDPRQYSIGDGYFLRWEPMHQRWERFATKRGIIAGLKCRCKGTGKDPWVYRTFSDKFTPGEIVECDSVGSASIMIARRVLEKIQPPHFQFLYYPSREILLTEDHYFCWKAKEEGFRVWGDLDMVCSHYKEIDLAGVMARSIRVFNAGMEYQKQEEMKKSSIVVPTEKEIRQLGGENPIVNSAIKGKA